jgi:hypothetical protein
MKKSIICFVIFSLLVMQMVEFGVVSAAGIMPIKEVTVLNELGIINLDLKNGYDETDVVTRAKFVEYVAKAVCAEPVTNIMYFYDVPNNYWAAGSINSMLERGVIAQPEDRMFNPDEPITYNQACKIMLSVAGYQKLISYENDKSMDVYARAAVKAGIDIKAENNNALTVNEAVKLIYNGLAADMVIDSGGKDTVVEGKTLFSIYHGIYFDKGIISSVYGANLEGSVMADKNQAVIDGKVFDIYGELNIEDKFGCYVEYVYKNNNNDDNYYLYYAGPVKNKNREIKLTHSQISYFDLNKYNLKYYETENSTFLDTINIDRGAAIIMNGRPYSGRLSDIIDKFNSEEIKGSVRLIDYDGNSEYELLIVKGYKVFVADGYDELTDTLYNYDVQKNNLTLGSYRIMRVLNEYGDEAELHFEFPLVLSVAASADGENIEIVICKNKVSGKITQYDFDGYVCIDDKETLYVDEYLRDELKKPLFVGNKISVVKDQFGDIVFADTLVSDEMLPVYLIKVFKYQENSEKFGFAVYLHSTGIKTYSLAKKVVVDKNTYKIGEYDKMLAVFPGNSSVTVDEKGRTKVDIESQIIRIRINSEDEIVEIDTRNVGIYEDANNTLTRKHDGTVKLLWSNLLKRFGLDALYSSSATKLFVVPMTSDDILSEELYKSTYTFEHDKYYYIETYQCNYDNFYSDIIVLKSEPQIEDETCFMFKNLSRVLTDDGEELNKIYGIANGGEISYLVDPSAEKYLQGLNEGDILRVDTNYARTRALNIVKMFNARTMKFENNGINEYWFGGTYDVNGQYAYRGVKYQLSKGYAYEIKSGVVKVTYNEGDLSKGTVNEVADISNTSITVFDSRSNNNRVSSGTLNDIITYKAAGADCSKIIINTRYSALKQVFIYK